SVAHGGGAVHAHDRASIFAEKRDFAALDHRLRLHLLLQDLAFGGIDKNLGDLPFEQVLFGFVAEHADQCGVGVEDAALGRGDVDAFPESFEELGEAGFIPPQSGNVARENGDAADGIAAQHGVSDTIEIKRRRLILQAYLNDTGPMTAFLETGHGAPGEIFFLFRAGLNKFGERTADNLLERRLDEIAEHAVDGANPPVDANRHQDVIEGVDQIAVALLRTGDDVKELVQLFVAGALEPYCVACFGLGRSSKRDRGRMDQPKPAGDARPVHCRNLTCNSAMRAKCRSSRKITAPGDRNSSGARGRAPPESSRTLFWSGFTQSRIARGEASPR